MFLTKEDLIKSIRSYRLDQMLQDDELLAQEILDEVLESAEQTVKDHLFQHYDTQAIFDQTGDDRKKSVLNWCRYVAMYQLYERVPDEMVPDRVVKNYDDTMSYLMKVAEGRITAELPRKTTTDASGNVVNKTKTLWGSQPPRSHNL